MAIYKMDMVDIELDNGNIFRSFLTHTIGSGDNNANRFGVRVFRKGVPVDLAGCSCQAVFMNAEGTNIALTSYGNVYQNEAYVTLPQACYNVEGNFCLAIKVADSDGTLTSRIVDGVVVNTGTTGAVAPTSSVPTYQEILSVYADMVEATEDAEAAVSTLPFDEQMINTGKCVMAGGDFEQGSINTSGADTASTKIIRTKEKIHVKKGMRLVFTAGTNCTHLGLRIYNPDGTMTNPSWIEKPIPYVFANDADLRMIIKSGAAATTDLAPGQYDATIMIGTVMDLTKQEGKYAVPAYGEELFGYFAGDVVSGLAVIPESSGNHLIYNASFEALPFVRIDEGDMLCLSGGFTDSTTYSVDFFDKDFSYLSYKYVNHTNSMIKAPSGAKYVRLSKVTATTMKAFILPAEMFAEARGTMGFIDLDGYGSFDGYKMNEDGISTSATTTNMSLSNYVPVEAGGRIWNISALDNSSTWGMMFYTSAMEAVEDGFVLNNTNIVTVPETAAYVRFTFLTDDAHWTQYYWLPAGAAPGEINVREFGAVGDRKTDDTRILQKMINIGGRSGIVVYIPRGNYLITDTLTVRYYDTAIRGDKWEVYSGSRIIMQTYKQTVDGSGNIVYEETSEGSGIQKLAESPVDIGVRVINYGFSIRDITFIPNFKQQGALWYDAQNLVATAIYVKVNLMDVDGQITGCHFRGCNVCISASGRNIEIENCLFVHSNVGVDIRWEQKYATEQREINVTNSRFHSCGKNRYNKSVAYDTDRVCIKFPDYIDPDLGKAFNIRNNFADYCGTFIAGALFGADVSMNTSFQCRNAFVRSQATVISPTGDGTTISGSSLLGDNPETDKGVNAHSLEVKESEGKTLTDVIAVSAGQILRLGFRLNTRIWGHALVDENGEIVDCIVANRVGDYIIPEGITGIRLTLITSQISTCSITLFDSYSIVSASDEVDDLTPIMIHDNRVIGATATDYTWGRNILEDAVIIKGYKNLIIDSNEFNNGVGNVISLDKCKKITITNNKMVNAPSYCEVYDEDGDLDETAEGTGKNYIKLTDCASYVIVNNVAISGNRHDGSTTPYVSTPVSVNGEAYTDASNKFINGAE